MFVWSVSLDVSCQVQARWDQDLHAIEESIRLMLGNRLQEAEDAETGWDKGDGICSSFEEHKIWTWLKEGNIGYPWEGTLAVVPQTLPHIVRYNHYRIYI